MKEGIFSSFHTTHNIHQSVHWEFILSIQGAPRITSHVKDISLLSLRHFDCMVHGHSSTLYYQAKPSSIRQNSFIYAVRPFIETFTEKFRGDLYRFYSFAQTRPVFVHYIIYFLRMPNQFSPREDAQGVTAFAIEGAFNSRRTTGLPIIREHASSFFLSYCRLGHSFTLVNVTVRYANGFRNSAPQDCLKQ